MTLSGWIFVFGMWAAAMWFIAFVFEIWPDLFFDIKKWWRRRRERGR